MNPNTDEIRDTHKMLYGTEREPVIEALFLLGARENETLPEVCKRRMFELGLKPGSLPTSWSQE